MSSLEVLPTSLASAETRAFATFLLRGPRDSASRCQCTAAPLWEVLIGAGSSSAHRFRALSQGPLGHYRLAQRLEIQRAFDAQRASQCPPALGQLQAFRIRMQVRTPTRHTPAQI